MVSSRGSSSTSSGSSSTSSSSCSDITYGGNSN